MAGKLRKHVDSMIPRTLGPALGFLVATGCAPLTQPMPVGPGTFVVAARSETVPVGTVNDDAADDPAIWRNRRNPAASLIVATDKKAGLHVYGLDGKSRHFEPSGRLNNVDLFDLGRRGIIVVASDRNNVAEARLQLYRLDPSSARLMPIGSVSGGAGEAYGICLEHDRGKLYAFSVLKQGLIHQVQIDFPRASMPRGTIVRTMRVATQPEGCVVDGRTKTLLVGEEDVGIWRFGSRADAPVTGTLVVPVDGRQLVADVEGLALAPTGIKGGWLIASSQGDNAYSLYRLPGYEPAGRFRIVAGRVGAAEETDGIALALGNFGPGYPGGLFIAQDGQNSPNAQNFKLVAWADIASRISRKGAK